MSIANALPVLTAKDFASDQEIRWCPRCGDYSILAQMKKILPTLASRAKRSRLYRELVAAAAFPIT